MNTLPLWGYALVLTGSLFLALLLTPMALSVAVRYEILDHPGPVKTQARAVPYLGGAAIVSSFAIIVLCASAIRPPPSGLPQLAGFMGLAVGLAFLGLVDDVRGGISPWLRLAFEAAAGAAVYAMGGALDIAGIPNWLDAALTVLWIVVVTNAFNLIDNMDGLSSGVAALTALTIFAIAYLEQRYLVAALAIALAGCAGGFLWHNFHPARIYMGDAGSLFLGFVLAVLLVKLRANEAGRVDMSVILAVPGVALFDTALVVTTRLAADRSPFAGGRDHTSHRILRLGYPARTAVMAIYGGSVTLDGAAIVMSRFGEAARIVGIAGLAILGGAIGMILIRVPAGADTTGAGALAPRNSAPKTTP